MRDVRPASAPAGFLLALSTNDLRRRLVENSYVTLYPARTTVSGEYLAGPFPTARPGLVVSGVARIFVTAADGRRATVGYARPGDAIGMVGLLDGGRPTCVETVTSATILYFDPALFARLLATEPDLGRAVAAHLAGAVTASARSLATYAFASVRQRVAGQIIELGVRDSAGSLRADVTQEDLAASVGSVREVVSRILHELRDRHVISTEYGSIRVMDEDELRLGAGDLAAPGEHRGGGC